MTVHVDDVLTGLRAAVVGLTAAGGQGLEGVLGTIAATAVATIGPAVGAGVSLLRPAASRGTDEDVRTLDRLQATLQEGPALVAAENPPESGQVHASDLAAVDRDRWPSFAAQAVTLGYRSLLALRVPGPPGDVSVLTLYARGPSAFDPAAVTTAGLFALQAATLLHGLREADGLRRALDTRDVIGQAKGVLVERHRCSDAEAFRLLVEASQQTSTKLVAVARRLVGDARRGHESGVRVLGQAAGRSTSRPASHRSEPLSPREVIPVPGPRSTTSRRGPLS